MKSSNNMSETLKNLVLQRKVSFAIIFGGAMVMAFLIAAVGLFVKQDKTLMLSVIVVASILAIIPCVLKLIKINSILRTKMEYSRS